MSDKYGVGDIEEWNGRVLDRVISYEDFVELETELAELKAKNREIIEAAKASRRQASRRRPRKRSVCAPQRVGWRRRTCIPCQTC